MSQSPDRALLARLVDLYESLVEDEDEDLPSSGDPAFVEASENLYNAIIESGYRAVIKNGMIYLPDYHGEPGEAILVDPAEPEDLADPNVLNFDKG